MVSQAKVFMSGNSQAVRLPRAFRLTTKVVTIQKTPQGILICDDEAIKRRIKTFASLAGACPDFPEVEANPTPSIPRDSE